MPNIPSFDLPLGQSVIHTESGGAQATARSARVTQETAKSIGDFTKQSYAAVGHVIAKAGEMYTNYQTTQDIATAAEQHTALAAQSAKDLPGILAKADDPVKAAQDYYQNTWLPAATKINQGMMTRASKMWGAQHMASASQSMLTHAIAEASDIQGAKTIAKFEGAMDNLGAAAHADPHGVDNYIKQVDSVADQMKGQLTPQQQAQFEQHKQAVKGNIYLAAGQTLAEKNPSQFKADLDAGWGKDFITVQQRQQLSNYTHVIQRERKQDAREASLDQVDNYMAKLYDPKTGEVAKVTPEFMQSVNKDPNLRQQDKARVIGRAISAYKEQVAINNGLEAAKNEPVTTGNLNKRIGDEYNPTTHEQVDEAQKQGLINSKTAQGFHYSINQMNSDDPKAKMAVQFKKGADTVLKSMTKTNNPFAPPSPDAAAKYEQGRIMLDDYIRAAHAHGLTDEDIFKEDGKAFWMKQPQFQKLISHDADSNDPLAAAKKLLEQQQGGTGNTDKPTAPAGSTPSGVDKARGILNGK